MSVLAGMIVFNSPEYAALHEAGHVEAALRVGARVVEVELYRDPKRSYGRTRVERTNEQSCEIVLGGFGVEYLLFQQGKLVKEDGTAPTEKEFIDRAIGNAADDYPAFWEMTLIPSGGLSECKMDWIFMNEAIKRAKSVIDFALVQRIASALLSVDFLDEAALTAALV